MAYSKNKIDKIQCVSRNISDVFQCVTSRGVPSRGPLLTKETCQPLCEPARAMRTPWMDRCTGTSESIVIVCRTMPTPISTPYPQPYTHLPPLQWRHHGHDGASNHQPRHCLLIRLFRQRSKKTSKLRVTGLCAGNSPVTDEFPAQKASNAENFPFEDVIMLLTLPLFTSKLWSCHWSYVCFNTNTKSWEILNCQYTK